MSEKQAKTEATPPPAAAAKSGFAGKLLIGVFMGGVIAVECALFYLFFPSAEQVAALAEHNIQKKLPANLHPEPADEHKESAKLMIEVDLGEYSVMVTRPNSPTVLRVDFHLVGTAEEEAQTEVKEAFNRNVHRFRDMVISEIRHLEVTDFADPGLALIKRRILEKSTTLFGKPFLKSLVFPDFSYFEQ